MLFSITAVSSIREEWRYTSNHTCWWLQGAQGQERKRRGTGSHSVVSLAQCLGHRSEERKEAGDQNSSWPLLIPDSSSSASHKGQKSSHTERTSLWMSAKNWSQEQGVWEVPCFTGPGPLLHLSLPSPFPKGHILPDKPALTCDPGLLSI